VKILVDRDIARSAILSVCRRLRSGKEARLDKNLLASSFPPGPDDRAFAVQLDELLQATNDGIFASRQLPGGDCVVIRRVRKELVPETVVSLRSAPRLELPGHAP
jgi:hypothetical protein